MKRKTKIISISIACIIAVAAIFVYVRYFYVFGEGIKAGNLNYLVYKGYVFKTYEGILIQEGFKSQIQGTIQNNEFRFSVADRQQRTATLQRVLRPTSVAWHKSLCGR